MNSNHRHEIKLHNGDREFTTISNLSEVDVFQGATRKWNRVIILLHGFPDDVSSFDDIWPYITSGFPNDKLLVLSPYMRGYEKSSQGSFNEYSLNHLASDVEAWILNINAGKVPVHLIGHDWGALVSYKAAELYPELITSIVTLAIPYLSVIRLWEYPLYVPVQIYNSSYMLTMQIPYLYRSRLEQTGNNTYLDNLWKYWSPGWKFGQNEIGHVKATFGKEGVIDSATAYYRCLVKPFNILQIKWKVDFQKVPTLTIGGEQDGCMSKGLYELVKWKLQGTENFGTKLLPHSGHFLQREQPQQVAELALSWFERFP
ncbi:epoxide hydrolase [Scheffersomyces amazonensis]|uniref:epoxide hydrolase n=1 Tax=Scheffersomyces amazonensis TaxID=1078765 RepID=UPI00315D95EC